MNKKVTMVIIIPQKRTYKPLLNEFRERLEEYPLTKRKHEEKTKEE